MSGVHDQLYKIRHSAAHVMAQAVREIFPAASIAIGPPIDDGFYGKPRIQANGRVVMDMMLVTCHL